MTISKPIIFFLIIAGLASLVQKAESHDTYISHNPPFSVELLSSSHTLGEAREILMGLRFKLSPGWKIYAPNAGKTLSTLSSAPKIMWTESKNVQDIHFIWPSSPMYAIEGFVFHAYEGEVIIPFLVKVIQPDKPLILNLQLEYSICSTLCMPIRHELTLTLPSGAISFTPSAKLLQHIKASVMTGLLDRDIQEEKSYFMMLVFAFLGGIILNFMPCVLPVISLKIMNIAKKGRHASSKNLHFRPSLLATFAGIIVSFAVLGAVAIFLNSLGESAGWGLHFQQPSFLCFLIVVTTLFASNLWGFYEIELPLFIRDAISKLLGYEHEHHAGLVEDFVAGIFATFLATPCTAPFLGTALGYAFSRSGGEIFLFFMVLGLGFSLPYWLGAILPRHWLKLPKPGAWMLTLSRILGYILALTTLWLLWILKEVTSFNISFSMGLSVLIMTFLFWIGHKKPIFKAWNKTLIPLLLVFSSLLIYTTHSHTQHSYLQEHWERFRPEQIPDFIQQGKVVLVDITASWCLTCKINKTFVLDSTEGEQLLSQKDVVLMRADWTRHDPAIATYLASYGRAGIPFNIVFGPHAQTGIILPEILSIENLKKAFIQAKAEKSTG